MNEKGERRGHAQVVHCIAKACICLQMCIWKHVGSGYLHSQVDSALLDLQHGRVGERTVGNTSKNLQHSIIGTAKPQRTRVPDQLIGPWFGGPQSWVWISMHEYLNQTRRDLLLFVPDMGNSLLAASSAY